MAEDTKIQTATFGYQAAYAWSCDCLVPHVPGQQIIAIRITEKDSSQEVTEQFVALSSRWNSNGLYLTLAEALNRLQQEAPYEGPGTYLDFFWLKHLQPVSLAMLQKLSCLTDGFYQRLRQLFSYHDAPAAYCRAAVGDAV